MQDGIRPVDRALGDSLGQETARLTRLVEDLYQLARAEIVSATRAFLERLPDVHVPPVMEPDLRIRWFHRHLDRLVVVRGPGAG